MMRTLVAFLFGFVTVPALLACFFLWALTGMALGIVERQYEAAVILGTLTAVVVAVGFLVFVVIRL